MLIQKNVIFTIDHTQLHNRHAPHAILIQALYKAIAWHGKSNHRYRLRIDLIFQSSFIIIKTRDYCLLGVLSHLARTNNIFENIPSCLLETMAMNSPIIRSRCNTNFHRKRQFVVKLKRLINENLPLINILIYNIYVLFFQKR